MNKKRDKSYKKWYKIQEKLAKDFKLSVTDMHNLYDLFYMITTPEELGINLMETLKLNKMDKWFNNFFNRLDDICLRELNSIHKNGSNKS